MCVGEGGLLLGNPVSSIMLSGTPFSKDTIPASYCCFSNFSLYCSVLDLYTSDHEHPEAHFSALVGVGGEDMNNVTDTCPSHTFSLPLLPPPTHTHIRYTVSM